MANPPEYKIDRTGNEAIDRNLDGIKAALDGVIAALGTLQSNVAAKSASNRVSVSNRSVEMTASMNYLSLEKLFQNTTVVLVDAVSNADRQVQIRHTSDQAGTPTVTIQARKLGGRQQLIGASQTASIALGATLTLRSDGQNWLIV